MSTLLSRRDQHGFSLVELSIVVAVLGVMTYAVTAAFANVQGYRQHKQAEANAQSAYAAVRAFALRNRRLPCPDTSSGGHLQREPSGTCTQASGWLPYESIGLSTPAESTRMRYGIYLQGAVNLAAPAPAASDGLDLDGVGGFLNALSSAAKASPNTLSPHYLQAPPSTSTITCSGGALTNPAFVIIAPATDIGGNGDRFESVNHSFGIGGSHCTTSPSRRPDAALDDVVVAESPNALLGWLSASLR